MSRSGPSSSINPARRIFPDRYHGLRRPRGFKLLPADAYSFGTGEKRHGGVLNITRSELAALRAKWPSRPVPLDSKANKPDTPDEPAGSAPSKSSASR